MPGVCGQTRTETAAALMCQPGLEQAYLDEVERALRCASRPSRGPVRIALIYDGKNEGFVGGMAQSSVTQRSDADRGAMPQKAFYDLQNN
jgi:hypothetical protein